jgi:general L-amino acid transport system substrate-binding protein
MAAGSGFDIDICRALAAVIFNDTEKAGLHLAHLEGPADRTAEPARSTSCRAPPPGRSSRNAGFRPSPSPPINYYDGQGFMVSQEATASSSDVKALGGASVCVAQGTTSELNLADYFRTASARNTKPSPLRHLEEDAESL